MKVPHFARKGDWFLWGILLSLLAVAGQARSLPQEVSRERLESHVRALSRLASRVPGYPGHEAATTYIRREFQVWGLRNVRWADLEVAVPVDEGAWLFVGEATSIRLYCLWPNLVRTPTLPPAGLTGPLLDGRAQGKRGGGLASSRRLRTGLSPLEGLAGREIEGSIVLLDFNCGQRWLELANLGAKALIFVEPATTWRGEAEQKFLDVPLNVPRFYLTRAGFRRLQEALQQQEGPATVRLLARMPWRRVKATNVWGYVRGTHAVRRREVICLQAYYDSMSVVPARAPGAESACGIAALLELARLFSRYPPQRTVLFLATTAHHLNNEGLRQWLEQHLAGGQEGEETGRERVRVDFLAALDLSSHGTQLGAFGVLGPQALPRVTGTINLHLTPYGRNFAAIGRAVAAELGLDPERAFIDGLTPPGGKPSDSFIPGRIALDSVAALTKGLTSLGLVTTNDGRWLVDTPLDTAERVNFAQLTQQVRVLAGLFDRALNAEELLVDTEVTINDETATLKGKVVYFNPRENFVPAEPIPGALALFQYGRPKTMMGVRGITIALTDEEGRYELVETLRRTGTVQAFKLDDTPLGGEGAGEIIYAPDRGVHGDQAFPMQVRLDAREKEHTIVLFPCLTTGLFELVDPQYLRRLDRLTVLNAADAVPVEYGFYIREGLAWTSLTEPVAAVFLKPGERFKVLAESGFLGKRMLLLNAPDATTKRRAEGLGYALETSQPLTLTPYCAARDMFQLDEYRLRNLHTFGIANDRVEAIHRQAGERLRQAAEARRQRQWSRFVTLSREALGLESRAYPDTKSTSVDVVRGIIFYLLLLLPFSFFTERLLFSFATIQKQILGTAGIFLSFYLILRLVHPAFQLTHAPEIILLGFVALALSLIVTRIISNRFEEQMTKVRRSQSGVYASDVGRLGALGVAFSLGIANMRRRKARTGLTCVTIILLTFTVLSFTSIKTRLRYNRILQPNRPSYQGFLMRDLNWWPLDRVAYEYLRQELEPTAVVVPRAWYTLSDFTQKVYAEVRTPEGKVADALGVLGLSPREPLVTGVGETLIKGEWFASEEEESCLLPLELARELEVEVGGVVTLFGRELAVKGLFDAEKLGAIEDLDAEPLTPADFSLLSPEDKTAIQRSRQAGTETKQLAQSFSHVDPARTVIVPCSLLLRGTGTLHSIAARFADAQALAQSVDTLLARLARTLYVGMGEQVWTYSSVATTAFGGLTDLLIPILIAALIVLNTMIGAVYERVREIGIYSSVGLAPNHIAMLFLGEAAVYALLGAMVGYLLGQVVAKFVTLTGVLPGLNLNYSSLSAVFSTLIVMATVLLSTLYPARKASELSVPDVTRRWEMPEPEGDDWRFDFPFTVNRLEVLGLFAYLRQYFALYTEESVGTFYTQGATLSLAPSAGGARGKGGPPSALIYAIEAEVWLAPYDLGVKQAVRLEAEPMPEEKDLYEIHVFIHREEGEHADWQRVNRRFLDGIRKQFLIWRTLDLRYKTRFRQEGEEWVQRGGRYSEGNGEKN